MACGPQASRYHQLEQIHEAPTGVGDDGEVVEEEWEWWLDLEKTTPRTPRHDSANASPINRLIFGQEVISLYLLDERSFYGSTEAAKAWGGLLCLRGKIWPQV